MGPAIYGMLAGEGQVLHGSVALHPLEKTPENESPHDGVAENSTAPSRKEGLPDPTVRKAMMAPGPKNLIIPLSFVDLIASVKGGALILSSVI